MTHDLASLLAQFDITGNKKLPPVHLWHPERVGSIDIRIDSEGRWFHEGGIFKREALVELFASILRLENEQYYLVTPAEKLAVEVADVPFIIDSAQMGSEGCLLLVTQTQQVIPLKHGHQWQLRDYQGLQVPYVCVRDNLYARVNRAVYYQLVELALEQMASNSLNNDELLLSSSEKLFLLGTITD